MNTRHITSGRRRLAATFLALAVSSGALLGTAAPSWAGTTPTRTTMADGSAYCKLLIAYTKKQIAANKALSTGSAANQIKAAAAQLQSIEGSVLAVAPSELQKSFKTLFTDLNIFYGELAKVNYKYSKLNKAAISKFAKYGSSMSVASAKITAYDKKVCGLKS